MRAKILMGVICIVFFLLAGVSFSAIPHIISFQGRLLSSAGTPVPDGSYSILFSIYDADTGGNLLWTETRNVTTVSGYYNLTLGSSTPINLAFDKAYYIGVKVGGDAEMTPRFYLGASGYCINAETLNGTPSSSFAQLNGSGNLVLGSPTVTTAKVSVSESGTGNYAGNFEINNASSTNSILYGTTNGTGSLLQLQKSGVDKFIVDNSGVITTGNIGWAKLTGFPSACTSGQYVTAVGSTLTCSAPASGTGTVTQVNTSGTGLSGGPFTTSGTITLNSGNASGQIPISNRTKNTDLNADMLDGIDSSSFVQLTSGNLLVGDPPVNATAKVSARETGTGNMGGRFEINNASNASTGVFSYTNGTGAAGYFWVDNASNSNPAVSGYTTGTGSAVSGYTGGTGYAGNFQIANTSNGNPAVYGKTNSTTTGSGVFGYTSGNGYATVGWTAGTASGIAGFASSTSTGGAAVFQKYNTTGSPVVTINSSGGTGNLITTSSVAYLNSGGAWYASGFYSASSREYKKDIVPLTEDEKKIMLQKLLKTEVVHFKYKSVPDENHIGVIAEDAPDEIVDKNKKALSSGDAIGMLIAAIKAQQKQIESLQKEIKKLQEARK